ncbi:Uncharacterised protein g9676 [Pycnogonum litorale]
MRLTTLFVRSYYCGVLYVLFCFRSFVESECLLPVTWRGHWFQKGIHPTMEIRKDSISTKGKCLKSGERGRFLFYDKTHHCMRCLLILQRHYNVLQYRETYCFPQSELNSLCSMLNSDEHLYSMFRADSVPIPCPFRGSYVFTYNRGGLAECSNPMSSAERCADESQLLLRFQACADIMGTESRVEKLTCLATWKDGLLNYVIGQMEHALVSSDNDRYRCFVYERLKGRENILRISQSPDATCNGLDHSNAGSRIMKLIKVKEESSSCKFPEWLTSPKHRHWQTLDMSQSYVFSHKSKSLFITEHPVFQTKEIHNKTSSNRITKIKCIKELKKLPSKVTNVVHITSGCSNGYKCMLIQRRQPHIIEITTGKSVRNKRNACRKSNFRNYDIETVTLVESAHTRHSKCPSFAGSEETQATSLQKVNETKREKREVCSDYSTVKLGCEASNTLHFEFDCVSPYHVTKFKCHGHWYENDITYLITTLYGSTKKVCLAYSAHNGKINVSARNNCVSHHSNLKGVRTMFSLNAHVSDSCRRPAGNLAENNRAAEILGKCKISFFLNVLLLIYYQLR